MANQHRGEVDVILNGKKYPLCLTLGALAELEEALGLSNIGELAQRFAKGRVKSADLVKILGTALRAGGAEISDQQAGAMQCDGGAVALTKVLVCLLTVTFSPHGQADDEQSDASPVQEGRPENPTLADP